MGARGAGAGAAGDRRSALARLGAGEEWELRGFRNSDERAAYEAVVTEVAEARGIAVTMRGAGTSLTVVKSA